MQQVYRRWCGMDSGLDRFQIEPAVVVAALLKNNP
jgi:hypothetical protein